MLQTDKGNGELMLIFSQPNFAIFKKLFLSKIPYSVFGLFKHPY